MGDSFRNLWCCWSLFFFSCVIFLLSFSLFLVLFFSLLHRFGYRYLLNRLLKLILSNLLSQFLNLRLLTFIKQRLIFSLNFLNFLAFNLFLEIIHGHFHFWSKVLDQTCTFTGILNLRKDVLYHLHLLLYLIVCFNRFRYFLSADEGIGVVEV